MDFFDAVRLRRSVRKYVDRPVEPDKLRLILEAARLAPSARNRQPWRFVVVTDEGVRREVYEASREQSFILEAPVLIAAVGYPSDYVCSNGNVAHMVDIGIAGEHIALAATALGLGSCWIAAFDQERMRKALNVPENAQIVAIFTIGYPAEEPQPKPRKPLREIVHQDLWGEKPPHWLVE